MLTQWLCSQFELPINAYLKTLDVTKLAQLDDVLLQLTFTGVDMSVFLHFQRGAVTVLPHYASQPSLHITGTPLAFCRLGMDDARTLAMHHDLMFDGDMTRAQGIMDALMAVDINWTLWMRTLLGDQITHVVDEGVSHVRETAANVHQSLSRNITEYCQEEARWIPPKEELNDFFDDVDAVAMAVDCLDERINRLRDKKNESAS